MCFSHWAAVFDPPLKFDGTLSPDVFSLLDSVSDPPLPFDGLVSPDVFSLLDSVSDPPFPLDGSIKVMLCSLCLATVIDPSFPLDGSVFPSSCRNWSSVEWGRTGEIYKTEPSWICWQQICLTANSSSTVPCQRYKSVKIICGQSLIISCCSTYLYGHIYLKLESRDATDSFAKVWGSLSNYFLFLWLFAHIFDFQDFRLKFLQI